MLKKRLETVNSQIGKLQTEAISLRIAIIRDAVTSRDLSEFTEKAVYRLLSNQSRDSETYMEQLLHVEQLLGLTTE